MTRIAGAIVVGVLAASVVVWMDACNGQPVRDFSRPAAAEPLWNAGSAAPQPPKPPLEPVAVEVHLDISAPMQGFLPLASSGGEPSALRITAQNAAIHLSRVYGGLSTEWFVVGNDLREPRGMPRVDRTLFTGLSSQLLLSVSHILAGLRTHRIEAAALVTDLTATGDNTGAIDVSNALIRLASDDLQAGMLHVGLLGARADYWGWHPSRCPRTASELGCTFDERTGRVTPLSDVARMPLYLLVLGKDLERVREVIESVRDGINELGSVQEIKWEVLTRNANRGFGTEIFCGAGEQFTLFEDDPDDRGQVYCVRDDTVSLSCRLGLRLKSAAVAVEVNGEPSGLGVASVRDIDGERLDLDIDCGKLREPAAPTTVRLTDVVGVIEHRWNVDWGPWSTEVDEVGKTLQLEHFVDDLRVVPDGYRIELQQPFLEFSGR